MPGPSWRVAALPNGRRTLADPPIEDQQGVSVVSVSSGIRRQLRENEGYGGIVVKLGLPLDEAMAVVRDIATELADTTDLDDPVQFDVQETPRNPALTIDQCLNTDELVQRLVAALESRGFHDAKLGAMPIVRPLHGHGLTSRPDDVARDVKAYIALPGAPSEHGKLRTWEIDQTQATEALRSGVAWAMSLPGVERLVDVSTGSYTTHVVADGAQRLMEYRLRDTNPLRLQVNRMITYSGHRYRSVSIPPADGVMTLAEGNSL